ncbi:MAG: FtsL-like putative cell division protein [Chitinophagales bacterium]
MAKKKSVSELLKNRLGQAFNSEEFEKNFFIDNVRFLLFLSLIAIIYIGNTRYAEKNMRQLNKTNRQLRELKWEYKSVKSQLEIRNKQSEIAKLVKDQGLEALTEPPKKIIVSKQQIEKMR